MSRSHSSLPPQSLAVARLVLLHEGSLEMTLGPCARALFLSHPSLLPLEVLFIITQKLCKKDVEKLENSHLPMLAPQALKYTWIPLKCPSLDRPVSETLNVFIRPPTWYLTWASKRDFKMDLTPHKGVLIVLTPLPP